MKIYLSHSREFDFKKELYEPIKQHFVDKKYDFLFPHENSAKSFNSFEYLKHECELMVAEVSYPSTGQGIELGWAHVFKVPIVCIYRQGSKPSSSLKSVTDTFIQYSNSQELVSSLKTFLKH